MFKPGDVLLYQAPAWKLSNLIPKTIQLITGNKVTHVALYLGPSYDGHNILDALSEGIFMRSLTEAQIYNRKDDFKLYGIARLSTTVNDTNVSAFLWSASKYTTKKYGYKTIFNLLLQHGKTRLFTKKPWTVWFKSHDAYICSEVTQLAIEDAFRLNQIKFKFPKVACLVEPDDYLSAPWEVTIIGDN